VLGQREGRDGGGRGSGGRDDTATCAAVTETILPMSVSMTAIRDENSQHCTFSRR